MSNLTGNPSRTAFLLGKVAQSAGNYFVRLKRYEEAKEEYLSAIAAYDQVLSSANDFVEAQENKEIVGVKLSELNVATALSEDTQENIEERIADYLQALESHPRETLAEDWARIQFNLGIAYSERIMGNRVENLEQAIACYQAALAVYNREAFPEDWVRIQIYLGTAYSERIWGDKPENLEQKIASIVAFLNSDDSVAIEVQQQLNSKPISEIAAQLDRAYRKKPYERQFAIENVLEGRFTEKSVSLKSDFVSTKNETTDEDEETELEELAENLLKKLDEIWRDDD
jgi:tetratricopeptide (TPR) repeat protein